MFDSKATFRIVNQAHQPLSIFYTWALIMDAEAQCIEKRRQEDNLVYNVHTHSLVHQTFLAWMNNCSYSYQTYFNILEVKTVNIFWGKMSFCWRTVRGGIEEYQHWYCYSNFGYQVILLDHPEIRRRLPINESAGFQFIPISKKKRENSRKICIVINHRSVDKPTRMKFMPLQSKRFHFSESLSYQYVYQSLNVVCNICVHLT